MKSSECNPNDFENWYLRIWFKYRVGINMFLITHPQCLKFC